MSLPSERICCLCDEPIEDDDWDNRHSVGDYDAHPVCCVAAGCESYDRLPLSMRNGRAT